MADFLKQSNCKTRILFKKIRLYRQNQRKASARRTVSNIFECGGYKVLAHYVDEGCLLTLEGWMALSESTSMLSRGGGMGGEGLTEDISAI
jgi:hypothetical protein